MKQHLHKVLFWLKNKYVICSLLFLAWMLLFDKNDIVSQIQLKQQLGALEKEKAYLQEQIKEVELTSKDLSQPGSLEKFAREEYLMKKENEDLFVIVEKEKE